MNIRSGNGAVKESQEREAQVEASPRCPPSFPSRRNCTLTLFPWFFFLSCTEAEPRASHKAGKCSTTELYLPGFPLQINMKQNVTELPSRSGTSCHPQPLHTHLIFSRSWDSQPVPQSCFFVVLGIEIKVSQVPAKTQLRPCLLFLINVSRCTF